MVSCGFGVWFGGWDGVGCLVLVVCVHGALRGGVQSQFLGPTRGDGRLEVVGGVYDL